MKKADGYRPNVIVQSVGEFLEEFNVEDSLKVAGMFQLSAILIHNKVYFGPTYSPSRPKVNVINCKKQHHWGFCVIYYIFEYTICSLIIKLKTMLWNRIAVRRFFYVICRTSFLM
jgi:hypothetical protein